MQKYIVSRSNFTILSFLFFVKCLSHNLCVLEVKIIYELFREKIKHAKVDKKYTNADIAKLTGYTTSTVEAFMCGARVSDKVARAISKALNVEL